MRIVQIALCDFGAYITHLVPKVSRGMHGKSKGHVDELLIVGVPNSKLEKWCNDNKIYITNRAVYNAETNEKILYRKGDTLTYVEKEKLNEFQARSC